MKMCEVAWCLSQAPCPTHKHAVPPADRCTDCQGTCTRVVAGAPVPCEKCKGSGRKRRVPKRKGEKLAVDDRALMSKMRPT